jgi:hypothetical protein
MFGLLRRCDVTAVEWEAGDDPLRMLQEVSERLGMRELRLYAVASCRRLWPLLDERCRQAVEAAEAWADREVSWQVVTEK